MKQEDINNLIDLDRELLELRKQTKELTKKNIKTAYFLYLDGLKELSELLKENKKIRFVMVSCANYYFQYSLYTYSKKGCKDSVRTFNDLKSCLDIYVNYIENKEVLQLVNNLNLLQQSIFENANSTDKIIVPLISDRISLKNGKITFDKNSMLYNNENHQEYILYYENKLLNNEVPKTNKKNKIKI